MLRYLNGGIGFSVDDLKANTEYTGYTAASSVVQWFWEVVKCFNKEDMARLLQFVTGTSKVVMTQIVLQQASKCWFSTCNMVYLMLMCK